MLHTLPLSQPKRASTVRVKRLPSVRNERQTRRRISDEEIGLKEPSASCGQDEQGAEDVREVPAGHGQDKQVTEDVREVPEGHGQDKQAVENIKKFQQVVDKTNRMQKMLEKFQQVMDKINGPGGARQAPAGNGQGIVGLSQAFQDK